MKSSRSTSSTSTIERESGWKVELGFRTDSSTNTVQPSIFGYGGKNFEEFYVQEAFGCLPSKNLCKDIYAELEKHSGADPKNRELRHLCAGIRDPLERLVNARYEKKAQIVHDELTMPFKEQISSTVAEFLCVSADGNSNAISISVKDAVRIIRTMTKMEDRTDTFGELHDAYDSQKATRAMGLRLSRTETGGMEERKIICMLQPWFSKEEGKHRESDDSRHSRSGKRSRDSDSERSRDRGSKCRNHDSDERRRGGKHESDRKRSRSDEESRERRREQEREREREQEREEERERERKRVERIRKPEDRLMGGRVHYGL